MRICIICNKNFITRTGLIFHVNSIHIKTCKFCHKYTLTNTRRFKKNPFYCIDCEKYYFNPNCMPLINIPHIKCDYCTQRFSDPRSLGEHTNKAHRIECSICNKYFISLNDFTYHNTITHNYYCFLCKIKFTLKSFLNLHIKTYHTLNNK